MTDFKIWCRQNKKRCVLVEIDYMYQVGVGGAATPTKGTLYLSNLGYVDESTSPPTVYREALLAMPMYERALDTATLRGAASVTISGPMQINNAHGEYDFLLTLAIDGSECRVDVGDPSWPRSKFERVFTALNARAGASKQEVIEVDLSDIGLLLNKSIGGTVIVGGTGPNAQKYRPLPFGYVHNMEPLLVESAPSFVYAYADRGTNASVPVVRANGAVLTAVTDYTDNGDGTFTLTGDPQGNQITCDTLMFAPGKTSTDYRISDHLEFFVGGEAGLTALGKYAGAHATYFDSGVTSKPVNDYHAQTLFADKTNVIAWLTDAMNTANGFWSQTRLGEFQYGRMRPEALSEIIGLSGGRLTVVAEIGRDDIRGGAIALEHRLPSYAGYQCLANVNQTPQTTFAGTLTSDERAMLSRDGLASAAFFGEETTTQYLGSVQTFQGGAPELYDLSLKDSPVIRTMISGPDDTSAPDPSTPTVTMAEMMGDFNSVRRSQFLPWTEFVTFTTFLDFYDLEISDIVNLTYPRFALNAGGLHQVFSVAIDAMNGQVRLGVCRRRFANVAGAGSNRELREDGGYELREDGGYELRE